MFVRKRLFRIPSIVLTLVFLFSMIPCGTTAIAAEAGSLGGAAIEIYDQFGENEIDDLTTLNEGDYFYAKVVLYNPVKIRMVDVYLEYDTGVFTYKSHAMGPYYDELDGDGLLGYLNNKRNTTEGWVKFNPVIIGETLPDLPSEYQQRLEVLNVYFQVKSSITQAGFIKWVRGDAADNIWITDEANNTITFPTVQTVNVPQPALQTLTLSGQIAPITIRVGASPSTFDLSTLNSNLVGEDQFENDYDLTNETITWQSNNDTIAKVEADGYTLSAQSVGDTTVKAIVDGVESNETVPVHVLAAPQKPTPVTLTPTDSATNVALDAPVSALFDADIEDAAGLSNVTISSTGGNVGGVSASLEGRTVTIAHDNFVYDTTYTVTIPQGSVYNPIEDTYNDEVSWSFTTKRPDKPTASPVEGTYNTNQLVYLSAEQGAEIRYTTDGSEPDTGSTLYTSPINVSVDTTIKATAIVGTAKSETATFAYVIKPVPAAPTADPPGGTYQVAQNVTLSAEQGAEIRYTTDGSEPDTGSTLYTSPINVSADTTIKAIAVKRDVPSEVETFNYIIQQLSGLKITPEETTQNIVINETFNLSQFFTVTGVDQHGNDMPLGNAEIKWALDNEASTVVDITYEAPDYIVKGTSQGQVGVHAEVVGLSLQSQSVTFVVGYPFTVEFKVKDAQGNNVDNLSEYYLGRSYMFEAIVRNEKPAVVQENIQLVVQLEKDITVYDLAGAGIRDNQNELTSDIKFQATIDVPKDAEAGSYTVKAFVWNGWANETTSQGILEVLAQTQEKIMNVCELD